jgi:hypothetical protein
MLVPCPALALTPFTLPCQCWSLPWPQLLEELAGQKVDGRLIIAINSITKLFVGDIVERGESMAGDTCTAGMCIESR